MRGSVCRTLFGLTNGLGSRNSKNATAPRSSPIPDVETCSGMYLPAVKREAEDGGQSSLDGSLGPSTRHRTDAPGRAARPLPRDHAGPTVHPAPSSATLVADP